MGLEHAPQLPVGIILRRGKGGCDLLGMMGVIVGDDRSVHFTIVFEPSSNSVEFFKTRGYFVGRYSVDSGGGESRDVAILEVEVMSDGKPTFTPALEG